MEYEDMDILECALETENLDDAIPSLSAGQDQMARSMALFALMNPAPVMRVDPTLIVRLANPSAAKIFGKKDLIGMKVTELIPGLDESALTGCSGCRKVMRHIETINGRTYQFTIVGASQCNMIHFYGNDITALKKTETELAMALGQVNTLVESAAVGLSHFVDLKFTWVNKRWESIFGYTLDEVRGKDFSFLFDPSWNPSQSEVESFIRRFESGEIVQKESSYKRKDGTIFWGRVLINAVDKNDKTKGFIAAIEDFTARKRMEENLRQSKEKAEDATKLKDKFISLVSHDLRAPLGNITGLLKLLQDEAQYKLDDAKKREIIDRVSGTAGGLIKLIDQLLDISRLQTGKITPVKKTVNAHTLASIYISNVEHLADSKGVKLVNKVPADYRIFADYTLFGEVLSNLLSNAIKFTKDGDTITVFAPDDKPGAIAVRDTGAGVEPRLLANLFKHEVKTSTIGTGGEKGTGLGLPYCHDIMTAHGGNLYVESAQDMGSVFYAELPLAKTFVLLVDDQPGHRVMMKDLILSTATVEILEAENGKEALDRIKDVTPHLIISDIQMPGVDGFELLRAIRKNPFLSNIPVIMTTSGASSSNQEEIDARQKAFALGANDFVIKPVTKSDFIPRIKRFLE